jgi:predicted HTH transcriptional regulator
LTNLLGIFISTLCHKTSIHLHNELQKSAVVNSQEDIEKIIGKGLENKFFEFKSSLRWDLKESIINKELEQVVIKTIAAFNNVNGGNLLIGVEDNGNVLGLAFDYKTFKKVKAIETILNCI